MCQNVPRLPNDTILVEDLTKQNTMTFTIESIEQITTETVDTTEKVETTEKVKTTENLETTSTVCDTTVSNNKQTTSKVSHKEDVNIFKPLAIISGLLIVLLIIALSVTLYKYWKNKMKIGPETYENLETNTRYVEGLGEIELSRIHQAHNLIIGEINQLRNDQNREGDLLLYKICIAGLNKLQGGQQNMPSTESEQFELDI